MRTKIWCLCQLRGSPLTSTGGGVKKLGEICPPHILQSPQLRSPLNIGSMLIVRGYPECVKNNTFERFWGGFIVQSSCCKTALFQMVMFSSQYRSFITVLP